MKPIRCAALIVLALLTSTSALAAGKGSTLLGIELSNGTADLYDPSFAPAHTGYYLSAYDHNEIGAQAQLWHFFADDYALALSAGFGTFSETDQAGNGAPAGTPDIKYTQSSFNVRLGGDRFVKTGDRASFYFGPGLEYWSGKGKFATGDAVSSWETQNVSRISFSGRIGAMMKVGKSVGFSCQLGRKLGMASATDHGAKATWWPSSFDAAGGIVFAFGD